MATKKGSILVSHPLSSSRGWLVGKDYDSNVVVICLDGEAMQNSSV